MSVSRPPGLRIGEQDPAGRDHAGHTVVEVSGSSVVLADVTGAEVGGGGIACGVRKLDFGC
ncbi:MAG: hypothetical protein JWN52_1437 [Actinomycetia bacterium]|nr:hypothetical protein [Actinomycetes bacterium]